MLQRGSLVHQGHLDRTNLAVLILFLILRRTPLRPIPLPLLLRHTHQYIPYLLHLLLVPIVASSRIVGDVLHTVVRAKAVLEPSIVFSTTTTTVIAATITITITTITITTTAASSVGQSVLGLSLKVLVVFVEFRYRRGNDYGVVVKEMESLA